MFPLLSTYIHNLDPIIVNLPIEHLALRWYGLAYVAGFVLGYWVLLQLAKRQLYCVKPQDLGDFITLVCLVGVIAGGRLGEFFFYWLPARGWEGLCADPFWVLRVWEGGMASHGGIVAVLLVAVMYAWRHHLSIPGVCDGLAIVCPIGLFFGRVANFINGELYGRICSPDNPLAMKFPQEYLEFPEPLRRMADAAMSQAAGVPVDGWGNFESIAHLCRSNDAAREALGRFLSPRFPSQLFEALGEGLVIFCVLITLRIVWKKAPNGIFSALFCFLYAAARIFSECFKQPDAPTWGCITRGQYLSFGVAALGVVFLLIALLAKCRTSPKA